LDKYRIQSVLRESDQSDIYLADFDGKDFAIKIYKSEEHETYCKKSLDEEIKAHLTANSDNLVKVYDFGECDKGLFMSMEYCAKGSLKEILETRSKLLLADILMIGLDICNALQVLHKNAIIHSDVKPENILLADNGKYKLANIGNSFNYTGIKKASDISYMAPEQYSDFLAPDERTDIYCLGAMLYHLFTGHTIHEAKGNFDAENKITPLEKIIECPVVFSRLINKMLNASPNERCQTIEEVQKVLAKVSNQNITREMNHDFQTPIEPIVERIDLDSSNSQFCKTRVNFEKPSPYKKIIVAGLILATITWLVINNI
jgi:serine/threonine protein kinase